MKKIAAFIIFAALALHLVSCGNGDPVPGGRNVNEVLRNGLEEKEAKREKKTDPVPESPETGSEAGRKPAESNGPPLPDVDEDLSVLSDTMVYAELYNIISNPKDHLGKTFRIKGTFAVYEGDERVYYACLVTDVTACCSQGLEFVLRDGSLKYPDDYPELGTEITVRGVFDTYEEGPYTYSQLIDAVIEK